MYKDNSKEIEARINKELESCGMPYKMKDVEGNVFTYSGLENGYPVYRTRGGSCHQFSTQGFEIIQQYAIID